MLSLAGAAYLAIVVSGLASVLALVTLLTYVLVYTPSKRVTWLCTTIGAVPGALPALIGWAAASGRLQPQAFVLFAVVFLWQFPHFMAIAWMYRANYDRAGYRVLPRGATRTPFTIVQTLVPLIFLLPVSLLPVLVGPARDLYAIGALVMGVLFLDSGMQFALRRTGARSPASHGLNRLSAGFVDTDDALDAASVLTPNPVDGAHNTLSAGHRSRHDRTGAVIVQAVMLLRVSS